jgi:hypothetical protein
LNLTSQRFSLGFSWGHNWKKHGLIWMKLKELKDQGWIYNKQPNLRVQLIQSKLKLKKKYLWQNWSKIHNILNQWLNWKQSTKLKG